MILLLFPLLFWIQGILSWSIQSSKHCDSPLIQSIINNRNFSDQLLKNSDLCFKGKGGYTVFHHAAERKEASLDVLKRLIHALNGNYTCLHLKNEKGQDPLFLAAFGQIKNQNQSLSKVAFLASLPGEKPDFQTFFTNSFNLFTESKKKDSDTIFFASQNAYKVLFETHPYLYLSASLAISNTDNRRNALISACPNFDAGERPLSTEDDYSVFQYLFDRYVEIGRNDIALGLMGDSFVEMLKVNKTECDRIAKILLEMERSNTLSSILELLDISKSIQAPIQAPLQAPIQAPLQTPLQTPIQTPLQTPTGTPTGTLSSSNTPTHSPSDIEEAQKFVTRFQILYFMGGLMGVFLLVIILLTVLHKVYGHENEKNSMMEKLVVL